ncbi:hypothetical protein FQN54_009020 [Arachnomyces sp. PD_36]|nr:hypothetical protein FQN54_009020 [Arachnomyces sp. PD_36]
MPLQGKQTNPPTTSLPWSTSSPFFALIAITLISFWARRCYQGCNLSERGSQFKTTFTGRREAAFLSPQRDFKVPELIKENMQQPQFPPHPPLPPISDASEAVLSHQHTTYYPNTYRTQAYHTQYAGVPQYQYHPGPPPVYNNNNYYYYYPNPNSYAYPPHNSIPASHQNPQHIQPTTTRSTSEPNRSAPSMSEKPPIITSPPPIYDFTHNPPSSAPPPYSSSDSLPLPHHPDPNAPPPTSNPNPPNWSAPPVMKQKESLHVYRGVGQNKGRTWRRKVLEFS